MTEVCSLPVWLLAILVCATGMTVSLLAMLIYVGLTDPGVRKEAEIVLGTLACSISLALLIKWLAC